MLWNLDNLFCNRSSLHYDLTWVRFGTLWDPLFDFELLWRLLWFVLKNISKRLIIFNQFDTETLNQIQFSTPVWLLLEKAITTAEIA